MVILKERTVVQASASTANLGPGFDVFGLALGSPRDRVTVKRGSKPGIEIRVSGPYAKGIPTKPSQNSAGLAAKLMLEELGLNEGLAIEMEKEIPVGMGLGSSGASAAGAVLGINALFNLKLKGNELVRFAARGERATAGFEHADNVSASILGGFVIIRSYEPLDVNRLDPPENMAICVASPHLRVPAKKTGVARSVLPSRVPLEKMVHNVGHAATIVAGFALKDVGLIGKAMNDVVVEPARAHLIPGYTEVRKNALKFGAAGVAISGAGPSMIAIVDEKKVDPMTVAEAMREAFEGAGVRASSFVTKPGEGARVLE